MAKRDYYKILEIDKSADESVIKKSYRKAAMKYHPDVNKEEGAEEKFKEINEAYEVLSDSNKKQIYDQYGHSGLDNQFGGPGGFRGGGFEINLDDLMNGSFGGFGSIFEDFFGGGFRNPNAPRKGRNIQQRIQITLEDAFKGKIIRVKTPKGEKEISIPAGISNGQTLRLHEDGEEGINGGPSGDLHIVVFVQEHKIFQVKGHDLFATIDIKYIDLLIGKTIETKHLEDKLKFNIPELSNPDKLIRIKGRGMSIINSKQSGDLYIRLNIIMPKKINKKAKKIIEELKKEL